MYSARSLQLKRIDDFEFLEANFGPFFLYFSTRRGGFSKFPYNTLNLSYKVGDEPKTVLRNRSKLAETIGIPTDCFATLHQRHGSEIVRVNQREAVSFLSTEEVASGDALITSQPVGLALFFADCLPVYLVDPKKKVAGLVHAGWRGLKEKIVGKTVEAMCKEFSVSPSNLFAWLGPSIGPCCYRVSSDFLLYFRRYPKSIKKAIDGQVFFNLKSIGYAQLVWSGVKKENIENASYCTSCQNELFFSYRRENGKTGRQAAILILK